VPIGNQTAKHKTANFQLFGRSYVGDGRAITMWMLDSGRPPHSLHERTKRCWKKDAINYVNIDDIHEQVLPFNVL
jgi:hypothetical protein